jgi:hypothetical protein
MVQLYLKQRNRLRLQRAIGGGLLSVYWPFYLFLRLFTRSLAASARSQCSQHARWLPSPLKLHTGASLG